MNPTTMKRMLCGLLTLLLGVLVAATAVAQPPPGQAPPAKAKLTPQEIKQRIRRMRAKVLRVQVGLDDAKADQAEQILDSFEQAHRDKQRAVRQARRRLRHLFVTDSEDEQAYQRALAELRLAHKELQQLREKQLAALAQVLTYKQQAKLLRSLAKLRRKLAKLRIRPRQDRPPQPPRPGKRRR